MLVLFNIDSLDFTVWNFLVPRAIQENFAYGLFNGVEKAEYALWYIRQIEKKEKSAGTKQEVAARQ